MKMSKAKRVLSVLLILMLVFSMAACGTESKNKSAASNPNKGSSGVSSKMTLKEESSESQVEDESEPEAEPEPELEAGQTALFDVNAEYAVNDKLTVTLKTIEFDGFGLAKAVFDVTSTADEATEPFEILTVDAIVVNNVVIEITGAYDTEVETTSEFLAFGVYEPTWENLDLSELKSLDVWMYHMNKPEMERTYLNIKYGESELDESGLVTYTNVYSEAGKMAIDLTDAVLVAENSEFVIELFMHNVGYGEAVRTSIENFKYTVGEEEKTIELVAWNCMLTPGNVSYEKIGVYKGDAADFTDATEISFDLKIMNFDTFEEIETLTITGVKLQ